MKKISRFTAIFLSTLSTCTFAYGLNGFYLGAGAGPIFASYDFNAHIRQVNPNNGLVAFNVQNNTELSGTGWFGSAFGGYGTRFAINTISPKPEFYVAGEINGDLSSLAHKTSNDEYIHANFTTTRFKMYSSWGLSLLPGYLFTDATMFYARLGYANTYFKVSTNDISLANIARHVGGFRWGLGMQQFISTQYAIRMEYNNVSYKTSKLSSLDSVSNTLKTVKITPHVSEVEFALVYNFC